jgi:hypothetical protein
LIEDRLENLLRCDEEVRHLPDGHLKVHLRELEKPGSDFLEVKSYGKADKIIPFEELRHPQVAAPPVRHASKTRHSAIAGY